jgi:hypothetical protein
MGCSRRSAISELRAWKLDALEAFRLHDQAFERLRKSLPGRYLGWNVWEAAADYIEQSEEKKERQCQSK